MSNVHLWDYYHKYLSCLESVKSKCVSNMPAILLLEPTWAGDIRLESAIIGKMAKEYHQCNRFWNDTNKAWASEMSGSQPCQFASYNMWRKSHCRSLALLRTWCRFIRLNGCRWTWNLDTGIPWSYHPSNKLILSSNSFLGSKLEGL